MSLIKRLFFKKKREIKEGVSDLVQMLDMSISRCPQNTALVFGAKNISYQDLGDYSKKLAAALRRLGVQEFDKVALWLPNCPEFVYAFFAILRLRAIVVPINDMFKREEARFVIEDCAAKVLICSVDKALDAQNILSRLETLEHVICNPAPKGNPAILDFSTLIREEKGEPKEVIIESDDLAEIIYTSGTTGRPKGACLAHKNLLSNINDCCSVITAKKEDCFICILPLFHSFSSTVCMLLPLSRGARIVIMRGVRSFKRVRRAIFNHRVTIFASVPSVYHILGEARIPRLKLLVNIFANPVRFYISGAVALPLNVWKRFVKKFHRPLLQGYGLTEASPVVSLHPLKGKKKPDSVGLPLPSIEVRVVDKEGNDLKKGEVGELWVKGPNVMQGYYNLEDETKETLKNDWLHTGDLVKIDKDGFIYIMGRIKEMINVRGLNVYPREIEDVLYRHPRIKEAAVVGAMHRHRGEVPIAFVVKSNTVTERDIIGYLRANLASYKVPLRVVFKDSLPKNPTGKILRKELQKEVQSIFDERVIQDSA